MCDEGEEYSCPGDCTQDDGGGDGDQTCCESADDYCGQRGDGTCQSGCAWGHDPDCDPQPPTDDAQCCGDPSDSCGWNGNGVCDAGCAWSDVDCGIETCDETPIDTTIDAPDTTIDPPINLPIDPPTGPIIVGTVIRCRIEIPGAPNATLGVSRAPASTIAPIRRPARSSHRAGPRPTTQLRAHHGRLGGKAALGR